MEEVDSNSKRTRSEDEEDQPIKDGGEDGDPESKRVKLDQETVKEDQVDASKDTTSTATKKKWRDVNIPNTSHYHVSWMHAHNVSYVEHNAKHGYVVTGSQQDGVVKFWKRLAVSKDDLPLPTSQLLANQKQQQQQQQPCLEFVKSFTAHERLEGLAMEEDWCASIGSNEIQIFDVRLFDSLSLITAKPSSDEQLTYSHAVWFDYGPENAKALAVAVKETGAIYLYSTVSHSWMDQAVTVHGKNPVTAIIYDATHRCMISADRAGIIELWDCQGTAQKKESKVDPDEDEEENAVMKSEFYWKIGGSLTEKKHGISYSSKLDTDLYSLVKKKTFATSLAICNQNKRATHFAVYSQDDRIRIFEYQKASVVVTYDERLKTYDKIHNKPPFQLDNMEYGTRAARERARQQEHDKKQTHSGPSIIDFDPSGKYLLVSTIMGIKVIDWKRNKMVCILGKEDSSQLRFTRMALCPGPPVLDTQMELARKQRQGSKSAAATAATADRDAALEAFQSNALLVALADQQRRLYVFSQFDIVEDPDSPSDILVRRDIWNEAPSSQDYIVNASASASNGNSLQAFIKNASTIKAILRTSMGDIHLQLFASQTPKTVENFVGHAKEHYYDNVIFHRVLKGFMIQTGDPLGDGTGGESIWGGEFEDEFVSGLRHDRAFTVSMANAGKNTNGSQFFITTVPCPWLDQKHTVFGRVVRGMDVCTLIENVKTDHRDKPQEDITIFSVDIE